VAGFGQVRGGRVGTVTTAKNRNFHVRKFEKQMSMNRQARRGPGSNAPLHYFSSIQMSIKYQGGGPLGNPQ
jgi:hypothetical protein